MKQVTLTIKEDKYPFFMELIENLNFIKKVEIKENTEKEQIVAGIKQAVEEMKLVKAGKLKPKPLKDLLDEL